MTIAWNDNAPIYRQLKDRVVGMMLDGLLKPGDALPSVRQIAADYHGDGHGLPQAKVATARDEGHLPIELRHEPVPGAIALGCIRPQRRKER